MNKPICLNCNKEFSGRITSKYCSNTCQQSFQRKQKIESGIYSKKVAFSFFKEITHYYCSCCGISEWNNLPLTLQIDHIDGNNENNHIDNLRYLCPNCHTQTDTWGVKNVSEKGRLRMIEGGARGRETQAKTKRPCSSEEER